MVLEPEITPPRPGDEASPDMTARLFRGVSLASSIMLLGVVLPINLLMGLPWQLDVTLFGFGAVSLGFHVLARRGIYLYRSFHAGLLITLDLGWLVTAGSSGSVNMWLYTGAVAAVLFFRGRTRVAALALSFANGCVLYLVEQRWPELVRPYADRTERLLDLVTGFVFASATCAMVVWIVLDAYHRERGGSPRPSRSSSARRPRSARCAGCCRSVPGARRCVTTRGCGPRSSATWRRCPTSSSPTRCAPTARRATSRTSRSSRRPRRGFHLRLEPARPGASAQSWTSATSRMPARSSPSANRHAMKSIRRG